MSVIQHGNVKPSWGYRHQQCVILFCCLTVAYSVRACMGVALVAMVETTKDLPFNSTNITNFNESSQFGIDFLLLAPPFPRFSWSKKIQDTILAAFSWGYVVLQVPAGQLAHRFGSRRLLAGALLANGVVSFCIPWAACYGGWVLVMICRVVLGLGQSCVVPCMHTAFGKWAPLEERGRLTAFAYGGLAIGPVLGMVITGFIAASPMGWPGIFRFYGIVGCCTGGLCWWLCADSPAKHKSISNKERIYIEQALGQSDQEHKNLPVPWRKLLRCSGLYAIVVAHIGHTWVILVLYSEVPAFMAQIMKVNIKANGLLTALPFFVMWLTNFFFSWFTDMLIVKKVLSVTNTRKLANSIGCVPTGIGLILLAYVEKDIYVVETILVVLSALFIALNLGYHVNHIDIAPNFAGTLISISNSISNLVGSLAPVVAGFILTDVSDELLWRKVFFTAAGVALFTNLVYVVFGTAELAEWNEPEKQKNKEEEEIPMMENR